MRITGGRFSGILFAASSWAGAVLPFAAQDVSAMPTGDNDRGIHEILEEAAEGSRGELYALGRGGGDGAWFALAEHAEAGGLDDLAAELRKRSYHRDPAPFARIALTRLLIDDPQSVPRAELELRRAEKRFGPDESLRRARIAVLAFRERDDALAEKMAGFTGRDWEAPVLAAALRITPKNEDVKNHLENFILHAGDAGVLEVLSPAADGIAGEGSLRLLDARLAFSDERYGEALEGYGGWLKRRGKGGAQGAGARDKRISPVFWEIAVSARRTRSRVRWARMLFEASARLEGGERYAAAYQAGRLFREKSRYAEAGAGFIAAAAAAPDDAARDSALRYRLKTLHENSRAAIGEELEAFSWAAGSWSRAEGFTDQLELFVHRRVRRGEWAVLDAHYRSWKHRWPAAARSGAALALAFAASEGRLAGKSADVYLNEAFEADPLSWAGLRAAGLLNKTVKLNPRPGMPETREVDVMAELLLRWGMAKHLGADVLKNPFTYSDSVVRAISRKLVDIDPRTSIRVSGVLWRRGGFSPTREDLVLQHPLAFGEQAAAAAAEYGVPADLFYGLIRVESGWDTRALSRAGAQGLTQFMPATWKEWLRRLKYPADTDSSDPAVNLEMGAAYMNWLLEREWTSGWLDVLVSYNAGGRRLRDWRNGRPGFGDDLFGMNIPINESRRYIGKVMSAATFYGYLYGERSLGELHRSWGMK